jgi:hypothetical protein
MQTEESVFDSLQEQEFLYSLQRLQRPLSAPSLLSSRHRVVFPREQSTRGVKLITHLHLLPTLRMCGAIPQPPYVFMAWCEMEQRTALSSPCWYVGQECNRPSVKHSLFFTPTSLPNLPFPAQVTFATMFATDINSHWGLKIVVNKERSETAGEVLRYNL